MNFLSKITGKGDPPKANDPDIGDGVTKSELEKVLVDGKVIIARLGRASLGIKKPEIARLVVDLAFVAQAIYEDFAKDPRDIKPLRNFIVHQAPMIAQLAEDYARLAAHSATAHEGLEEAEQTLFNALPVFLEFQKKCLENDGLGLEVQSATLDTLLQAQRTIIRNSTN